MSFYVSKSYPLVHSSLKYIDNPQIDPKANLLEVPTIGGIVPNLDYAWVAKGPDLEVLNTVNGCKIGAWTFGGASREQEVQIVAVERIERPHGKLPLLAVGVNFTTSGSMVCIFDPPASKVIRTIKMYEKITSLHVIDPGSEISTIPGPLRTFDGIMAIGTNCGNVFLLDMCLQACEEDILNIDIARIRDEFLPCQMMPINFPDITRIEHLKSKSLRRGEHLGFHLNAVLGKNTEHFVLKGQDGEDRLHVNKDEVTVTALHFCPQLASVLVGYNFGAFQIWNLVTLEIVYTSPVCEDHIPITHFAIQEPVDDPRAFCYVWVAYSPETLYLKGFPYAVMYSLFYSSKEHLEDYGLVYKDFQSSMIRFEMELNMIDNRKTASKPRGGQNLRLYSICRGLGGRDCSTMDGNDDVLALCLAVWTVWCSDKETYTYAAVFDLNQWYKEQMPRTPDWENCSNYLIHVCISDLVNPQDSGVGPVLDVYLPKKGLSQFRGAQRLEEHFYPTSLIFDLCCVRQGGITFLHNQGLQKTLLSQIEMAGPLCLMKPDELYHQIITLGLAPLFVDIPYQGAEVSVDVQRSLILDVALEQQLLGWLCKCASEWANGSFISIGCSLDLLLNWAYQRLIALKTNCDKLCIPLFDHSELKLDTNAIRLLNCCCRQINNLSSLYTFILAKLAKFLPDLDLIEEQCALVHNLSVYYEVLLWLFNMGLLPECPLSSREYSNNKETVAVPYASEKLTSYFLERRIMLKQLNKSRFSCDQSLLFIDNFLEFEHGGAVLQREWQKDGGSGFYPPSSLQALLRTYLVEQMSTIHKHMVLTYLFLDLAMTLNHQRFDHVIPQLVKFPTIFKVNLSLVKLTQAFWELDHGGFISAIEQLMDPLILTEDLKPWHHKVALRSFLLQDQQKLALLYLQVRKPPVIDEEDILTTVSLYVSNKMIDEAFYFQKQHEEQCEYGKLLIHLFNECNKYDTLPMLISRVMNSHEEEVLLNFLKKQGKGNMELIYFMVRSRYLEAFTKHESVTKTPYNKLGLMGQMSASSTDYLVNCFKTLLPNVSTKLVDVCRREKTSLWQEVARPTPMSVFVHNPSEKVHYKSTLINAALTKAKHTFSDSFLDAALKKRELVSEETPFLRTPTSFPAQKRKSIMTITPKIVDLDADASNLPPSAKKRKLTPTVSPRRKALQSNLDTPIVKRRTSKDTSNVSVHTPHLAFTPQSILKVRELVRGRDVRENSVERSRAEASYMGIMSPRIDDSELSVVTPDKSKNSLKLSPRKSLPRTPRPAVHFEDSTAKQLSRSNALKSPSVVGLSNVANLSDRRSVLDVSSSKSQITIEVSKTESTTTSEEFYSPEGSFGDTPKDEPLFDVPNHHKTDILNVGDRTCTEDVDDSRETERKSVSFRTSVGLERSRRDVKTPVKEVVKTAAEKDERTQVEGVAGHGLRSRDVKSVEKEIEVDESAKMESTPKPRRGIRSLSSPIRSSPRLSRIASTNNILENKNNEPKEEEEKPATSTPVEAMSPRLTNKIRGRKSLTRKVLEANAINRLLSSSLVDDLPKGRLSSIEYSISKSETTISSTASLASKESSISHSEVKHSDTYTSEGQDGQFKHDHSEEKSSSKKKVFEETMSDTSLTDSDISLTSLQKTYDGPQLSDSILEYMKQRQNERNHSVLERTFTPEVKTDKQPDDNVQNNSTTKSSQKVPHGSSHTEEMLNNSCRDDVENHRVQSEPSAKGFLTKRRSINRRSVANNNDLLNSRRPHEDSKTSLGESALQQSRKGLGVSNCDDSDLSDVSLIWNKTYDGPQMSDSLIEYIKERQEKREDYADQSHISNNGALHEPRQISTAEEPTSQVHKQPEAPVKAEGSKVCSEVVVIETSGDSEPMEVDEVDIYEGLSDDGENANVEDAESPLYEDISNSFVPCGDPEMNNFEYHKDLTRSNNTQMTKEYVGDTSLVLAEDVLDEMTKSSSESQKVGPSSTDEEISKVHEKGFIREASSSSNDSSRSTDGSSRSSLSNHQSHRAQQKPKPTVAEVIEISSSDSGTLSSSQSGSEDDDPLNICFDENLDSDDSKSTGSSHTEDYNYREDNRDEDRMSEDRESIHHVIKDDDDSNQQGIDDNDVDVRLVEEEVVSTKDMKNCSQTAIEGKSSIDTINISEIVDKSVNNCTPSNDRYKQEDVIVGGVSDVAENVINDLIVEKIADDSVKPSSSLGAGYNNLVNEIFDGNVTAKDDTAIQVQENVVESSGNCQIQMECVVSVEAHSQCSENKIEQIVHKEVSTKISASNEEEAASQNVTDVGQNATSTPKDSVEVSFRSEEEEFHLHISEDTDESQEKLKDAGADEKSTVTDVKTPNESENAVAKEVNLVVKGKKTEEEDPSPVNMEISETPVKVEFPEEKSTQVPSEAIEKLGTKSQPYVMLRSSDVVEKSLAFNDSNVESVTSKVNSVVKKKKSKKEEPSAVNMETSKTQVHVQEELPEEKQNTEIPSTTSEAIEKLGAKSQPYVILRSCDVVENSPAFNDSNDDSITSRKLVRSSSQRRSPSRLSLPVRRSRRLSASSRNEDDPLTPLSQTSTPIRHITDAATAPGTSTEIPHAGTPGKTPPRRGARTRSVDLDALNDTLTDGDKAESTPTRSKRLRAGSVSHLPAIDEEKKVVGRGGKTRSVSAMEEYSVSRRLTRRQADMLQKTLDSTPKTVEEEEEMQVIEEMDPIQLLDKEPFEGRPDPEEQKVYEENSPTNSIETGSVLTKRTRRSTSVASDNSMAPSDVSVLGTPKKRRTSVGKKDASNMSVSTVVSGVRTRSRTMSVDEESTVSQKTDTTLSPVKTRRQSKTSSNADTEVVEVKSTRSRTKSVSSVRSATSDGSKRSTRARKQVTSVRSDLPEIPEER